MSAYQDGLKLLARRELSVAELRGRLRDREHPAVPRMLVSARTGEGVEAWRDWLVHAAASEEVRV